MSQLERIYIMLLRMKAHIKTIQEFGHQKGKL
jgi:hypothetical protein